MMGQTSNVGGIHLLILQKRVPGGFGGRSDLEWPLRRTRRVNQTQRSQKDVKVYISWQKVLCSWWWWWMVCAAAVKEIIDSLLNDAYIRSTLSHTSPIGAQKKTRSGLLGIGFDNQ